MPVSPDCLKIYPSFKNKLKQGVNEHEAVRDLILAEHKALHDKLNDIRKEAGIPRAKYEPPKINDTKEINDKYQKLIDEQQKEKAPQEPIIKTMEGGNEGNEPVPSKEDSNTEADVIKGEEGAGKEVGG